MEDQQLSRVIGATLQELEIEGEIVITSPGVEPLADRVAAAVLTVVPHTGPSHLELLGLRSLVLHAVRDKRFFDCEMPTLTGFSAEEFQRIAEKLPLD